MTESLLTSLPILLSTLRLLAGPLFLVFGSIPASVTQIVLLLLVVLTDLADGRLARSLDATSRLGAGLDTTADKVFVLCLLLKLMLAERLPSWMFYVMLGQFLILAVAGSIFVFRFGTVPIPDLVAKGGALLAFVTVLVGVAMPSGRLLLTLATLTILANAVHLVTAFLRITSDTGELKL